MSRSEFKTWLKRRGFRVRRNFYQWYSVGTRGGRQYLFGFMDQDSEHYGVRVGCPMHEFDRWAVSTERHVRLDEWLVEEGWWSEEDAVAASVADQIKAAVDQDILSSVIAEVNGETE